jgi:hypothetical protein
LGYRLALQQRYYEITALIEASKLPSNVLPEKLQAIIDHEHAKTFSVSRKKR